ncbi:sugar transporter-domain-containing protein [Ustulina deusta]|nr:sugar transporter-domain-containing protein [Ustulina deusta]
MISQRGSSTSHALHVREHNIPSRIELDVRAASVSAARDSYQNQRRSKTQQLPSTHLTDEELERDAREFQREFLPRVEVERLLRAVQVAKYIRIYDAVARSEDAHAAKDLSVQLTGEEKIALKKEKDSLPSEPTMLIVVLTVSLAAFLQGFVQSSINGASLYAREFGLDTVKPVEEMGGSTPKPPILNDWKLGAVNASPFLFAALVGCWLALPINERVGRNWQQLFGVRVLNGIGQFSTETSLSNPNPSTRPMLLALRLADDLMERMGIKAVSTPILASETAVGYWRGTSILAWQLWVAFGIAIGFAFNLIFYTARDSRTIKQLILGAPLVPSIFLLASLCFCAESPRYYMRRQSAHFDPEKAYAIMVRLRGGEFLALRDIYLIYKSVQQEEQAIQLDMETDSCDLFTQRRLRNALISSSIVSLAQQLCGINVFAFYSGPLFNGLLHDKKGELEPMLYSLGYGAVNFLFGLPAIRTIDTLGRRKWLVLTLPLMCLFMTAAALSTLIPEETDARGGVVALFVFLFAAAYSPGLGPIPFTLAIYAGLHDGGTLGLFAGLNLVAFALIFLLVEETKRRSLEDLNAIFAVRKSRFTRYQVMQYLPWFFRRYILGRDVPRPELYLDLIWGNHDDSADHHGQGGGTIEAGGYGKRASGEDDDHW